MPTHALAAIRTFMHEDGAALLPEMELLLFAFGILAMDFWIGKKEKYWSPALAFAGTFFSGLTLWMLRARVSQGGELIAVNQTVVADSFFIFFSALLLIATALAILLSINDRAISLSYSPRYYAFLLFACAALMLLLSAVDLLVIFLSLEAAAIASYFLKATPSHLEKPNPGAITFLLTSFAASAFLAYGFSLLYGLSASTNLAKIAPALHRRYNLASVIALSRQSNGHGRQMQELLQARLPEALHWHPAMLQALPMAALALILFALLLKFKAVFISHWPPHTAASPAPARVNTSLIAPIFTPTTALVAAPISATSYLCGALVISFVTLLLRLLLTVFADSQVTWWYLLAACAVLLISTGVVGSLLQSNLIRLLTYALLAQVGFFLLAIAANEAAFTAISYSLFAYLFMTTGVFAVLLVLNHQSALGQPVDRLADLQGLRHRSPITALLLIIFALAIAGFPPTAGFYARYLIFQSLSQAGHRYIAWFSAAASLPLAYAVLRIAVHAWRNTDSGSPTAELSATAAVQFENLSRRETSPISFGVPEAIVLGICVFVSLAAGLYADPFVRLARYAFGQ